MATGVVDGSGLASIALAAGVLMESCDSGAFDLLYERYSRSVYRTCQRLLPSLADAEDATQETFLAILPRLGALPAEPGPYLKTVARHVCIRRLRRLKMQAHEDLETALEIADGTKVFDSVAVRIALDELTRGLSIRDRLFLAMQAHGYTSAEIGRRVGAGAGAVDVAVHRARRRARQVLEASGALALAWWLRWSSAIRSAPRRQVSGAQAQSAILLTAGLLLASAGMTPHTPAPDAPRTATQPPTMPAAVPHGAQSPALPVAMSTARTLPLPPSASHPPSPSNAGPSAGIREQDAQFEYFTESPSYQSDHTIYASGFNMACGSFTACSPTPPVIFVSHDRGATWTVLPAAGFQGGQVILAPSYAQDGTLFVTDGQWDTVQESTDGGNTFKTLPLRGIAVAGADPAGGAEVAVWSGAPPLLFWHQRTGTITRGPTAPVVGGVAMTFMPGGSVLMLSQQHVYLCPQAALACSEEAAVPAGADRLAISPNFARDHALAAYGSAVAAVSADGGKTFETFSGLRGNIIGLAIDPAFATTRAVVLATWDATPGSATAVYSSTDAGTSYRPVSLRAPTFVALLQNMVWLDDGTLMAAVLPNATAGHQFGVACSRDGGTAWSVTCG